MADEIAQKAPPALHGRGASFNPPNRFEPIVLEPDPEAEYEEQARPRTQFFDDASQSILAKNDSPDVPFTYSLNAYRGCEHGCAYCYARAYHDYLGWSAGLDFETKILVKRRAPELLREALASPRWEPQIIAMSGATDCYQPVERKLQLTRRCLEVLREFRNSVGVITKNYLVTRDRDVIADLAAHRCALVNITVTTLDAKLSAALEPRAALPELRLRAMRELAEAGVPVGVMVAPIIPGLTDHEMPGIIEAAAAAGARYAGYTVLRLPHAVKDVFTAWLHDHEPGKAERVLSRVRQVRGGELNRSAWGQRLRGEGIFAEQIALLFKAAVRRAGLSDQRFDPDLSAFRRPGGTQLTLFA